MAIYQNLTNLFTNIYHKKLRQKNKKKFQDRNEAQNIQTNLPVCPRLELDYRERNVNDPQRRISLEENFIESIGGEADCPTSTPKWLKILNWISISGFFVFLVCQFVLPAMVKGAILKEFIIEPGTKSYEGWTGESPDRIPIYLKVRFFDLKNPTETLSGAEKPKLAEMGPYVFEERHKKTDVFFNKTKGTLSYKVVKSWIFLPEMSRGSLADEVTTLNVPMVSAANVKKGSPFELWVLGSAFELIGSRVFIKRRVGQLLFEGYDDELMSLASLVGEGPGIPVDKFGWFYKRNNTNWFDGAFETYTGGTQRNLTGQIVSHNGRTRTEFPGKCGEIRGSAEGFFPPNTRGRNLSVFSHETCRVLDFNFKSQIEKEGVNLDVYTFDETTFANGSVYPPNSCYQRGPLRTGIHDNTKCKGDSSAFISFPHFYLADPWYRENFQEGSFGEMSEEKYGSKIALEPNFAIPMEFLMRLQINIRVQKIPGIRDLDKFPFESLYFPCLWFEASSDVPAEVIHTVNFIINLPEMMSHFCSVFLSIATLIAIVGFGLQRTKRFQTKKIVDSSKQEDANLCLNKNEEEEKNVGDEERYQIMLRNLS